ncbi:MAG: radical SAM protein [Planctomycetota bacterium]
MSSLQPGPRSYPHRTTVQRLNTELALASLERGEGRVAHRPLHVALQVASACNLDCYMCLEHTRPQNERHGRNLKSLSLEVFEIVERELLPYSTRMSFAIGGEPTLAENFEHFLERAFLHGQEIELLTNGTRLDHGNLAEVAARCVSYLQISIEGATRETYERIRGGASFAHLLANVELFNRHRARYRREDRTHLSFWVTLMRSSIRELPQIVELAHRLDVDRVHGHHASPATREAAEDTLEGHAELWNSVRLQTLETARRLGVDIDLPPPADSGESIAHSAPSFEELAARRGTTLPDRRNPKLAPGAGGADDLRSASRRKDPRHARMKSFAVPCHLPGTAIYVLWDGRVLPCCYTFAMDKLTLGLLPRDSIDALWNGRLFRNLRVGLVSGEVPPVCLHCPVVHDVPVTPKEEQVMRASQPFEEWLGNRELPGADAGGEQLLERLRGSPTADELDDLRRHAQALEAERAELRAHAKNLEEERPHLQGHIANLEAERPHWLAHIQNLERELAELRRKP